MTAFLHYFFLATFTWSLCEAVVIYILLVKVFGANDKKWIYLYLALGWGKPVPTALISIPPIRTLELNGLYDKIIIVMMF